MTNPNPELLSDPSFASGTPWTVGLTGSSLISGAWQLDNTSVFNAEVAQDEADMTDTLVDGGTYEIEAVIDNYVSGGFRPGFEGSTSPDAVTSGNQGDGTFRWFLNAPASVASFRLLCAASGSDLDVVDVSLKEARFVHVAAGKTNSDSSGVYTISSLDLDTPFTNARFIVLINHELFLGRTLDSITLGGETITVHGQTDTTDMSSRAYVASGINNNGSTGDLVVSFSADMFGDMEYHVIAVEDDDLDDGSSPTVEGDNVDGGTSVSVNLNVGEGDLVVGLLGFGASSTSAYVASDEAMFQYSVEGPDDDIVFIHPGLGADASFDISGNWSNSIDGEMIVAHWAAAATGGPRNPLGHPLKGPFGGPIG